MSYTIIEGRINRQELTNETLQVESKLSALEGLIVGIASESF